jgi:hypothetical protein
MFRHVFLYRLYTQNNKEFQLIVKFFSGAHTLHDTVLFSCDLNIFFKNIVHSPLKQKSTIPGHYKAINGCFK